MMKNGYQNSIYVYGIFSVSLKIEIKAGIHAAVKWDIVNAGNGLSYVKHWAIVLANNELLSIWSQGKKNHEILKSQRGVFASPDVSLGVIIQTINNMT